MNAVLAVSRLIDRMTDRIGHTIYWLVLVAILISAANATVRKIFNYSSNSFLEIQWYLFSLIFLFCAGYTLKNNEHVRIDIITGRLDMQFATVGPTLANISQGKLRALATTGRKHVSSLPDVPTMMEAGVKDYDVALWIAYVAPVGTPDAIVAKLNRAMGEILREPDIVANLQKQGFEPDPGSPGAVTDHIRSETAKWRDLVAKTGIKPE